MPASLRAHVSRATSSRPYDRRSPTVSPAQSENPRRSQGVLAPAPPIEANTDQNAETDAPPDHPGLPTYAEYKRIEAGYLLSLSPRKRDKALITQAMFDKIWDVLHQPEACTIETPQFRFWVRKMFTLSWPVQGDGDGGDGRGWGEERADGTGAIEHDPDAEADLELERSMGIGSSRAAVDELGYSAVVLHENRPVAIMEQLYELFCYCHARAGHGGRDKTCAVIREHYSWVPKELTAQFVKACPTCLSKRGGHAYGGVGGICVDVGMLAHKRGGGRARRGRAMPLERGAEVASVTVEPLSLGWPTTGGPLDPANPEPCGMREREREWRRARGDAGAIHPSSPVSPLRGSVPPLENCLASGWSSVPRAVMLEASPFRPCDTARSLSHLFALNSPARQSDYGENEKENRSPTRTALPPLASALSNESLDMNVNLTELELGLGLGPAVDAANSECVLPPALRPLRLLGPASSDSPGSDLAARGLASYPFQIDPVLLSFNYTGLGSSSRSDAGAGIDGVRLGLSTTTGSPDVHRIGGGMDGHTLCRVHAPTSITLPAPEKGSQQDPNSPDARLERTVSYVTTTTLNGVSVTANGGTTFSDSTERMAPRRCGTRYGPLATVYPCSTDGVGDSELDRSLSFSILTDA